MHTVQAIGDSTGSVLGLARCGAPTGVVVQTVQFCNSWTRLTCPSLLCLVPMARQRKKNSGDSTGAVPGQGLNARRPHDRCFGPDVQETVGVPQLQFFDEVGMPVVVQRQVPWSAWQRSWTRLLPCPLLCALRVQTRRKLWVPQSQFFNKVYMPVVLHGQGGRRWFRQFRKRLEVPPMQLGLAVIPELRRWSFQGDFGHFSRSVRMDVEHSFFSPRALTPVSARELWEVALTPGVVSQVSGLQSLLSACQLMLSGCGQTHIHLNAVSKTITTTTTTTTTHNNTQP